MSNSIFGTVDPVTARMQQARELARLKSGSTGNFEAEARANYLEVQLARMQRENAKLREDLKQALIKKEEVEDRLLQESIRSVSNSLVGA